MGRSNMLHMKKTRKQAKATTNWPMVTTTWENIKYTSKAMASKNRANRYMKGNSNSRSEMVSGDFMLKRKLVKRNNRNLVSNIIWSMKGNSALIRDLALELVTKRTVLLIQAIGEEIRSTDLEL